MRITRPTLQIFLSELEQLEKDAEAVREAATNWTKEQQWRDDGYSADQEWISVLRNRLEKSIIAYRRQLAKLYDFSGDSGLR
jgi:hypothetical protein